MERLWGWAIVGQMNKEENVPEESKEWIGEKGIGLSALLFFAFSVCYSYV